MVIDLSYSLHKKTKYGNHSSQQGSLRHQIASRPNGHSQPDWNIGDQAKTGTQQLVPMMNGHSADFTTLPIGTGKQYSNRKETSCVPLLNAGFEPGAPDTKSPADWMLADKPTELSRIKLTKLELDSPSLWSASIQPTWPHCQLTFAPGSVDIHICCC